MVLEPVAYIDVQTQILGDGRIECPPTLKHCNCAYSETKHKTYVDCDGLNMVEVPKGIPVHTHEV